MKGRSHAKSPTLLMNFRSENGFFILFWDSDLGQSSTMVKTLYTGTVVRCDCAQYYRLYSYRTVPSRW